MFIPIEGEDCILLSGAIAFVHGKENTAVHYADGTVRTTGFRPVTLKARYVRLMERGAFDMATLRRD